MSTKKLLSLPSEVEKIVDRYYRITKLENDKTALIFEEFFSKNPHKERQPFQDLFMKICVILLGIKNHPSEREGAFIKAMFLEELLGAGGMMTEVHKHELEEGECLYNIVATTGYILKNKTHGLLAFHHDTIKQDSEFVKAEITDGNLTHPWILDDTIHVASGILEALRFASDPDRVGAVTIIITDREEMNTLGMKQYLEKQQKLGKLHPYSWIITGESTGLTTGLDANTPEFSELVIAVVNRGKGVREYVSPIPDNIPIATATRTLIAKIRQAQKYVYSKSLMARDTSLPPPEQLIPTAVIPTVVSVNTEKVYVYLEFRTDENMGARETADAVEKVFNGDVSLEPAMVSFKENNFDSSKMTMEIDALSDHHINIICGVNQHPGKYDSQTRVDAISAIEYVLSHIDDEISAQILEITIGEKAKPNSMSNKAVIRLKTTADKNAFLEILRSIPNLSIQKNSLSVNFSWIITRPDHVPDRETIRMSKNNRHIVEKVQETIADNVSKVFGRKINASQILTGVFNAMHDGGAITVKKEWYEAIFPQGSVNMIVLGAGNFNMLHNPQEPMSYNTLNLALCQYNKLIDNLNNLFDA